MANATVVAKRCNRCRQVKNLSLFSRHPTGKHGRRSYCKACGVKIAQAYRQKDPRCDRRWQLWRKYRMTIEQYDRLMSKQKGKCAICKCEFSETDRALIPCVDHDHQTGAVRGLLCFNCNTVLGKVKDSPQILKRAISYLERF